MFRYCPQLQLAYGQCQHAFRRAQKYQMEQEDFFTLLSRVLLNSFTLYQSNTKNVPELNRQQFMIKLVEGLTSNSGAD